MHVSSLYLHFVSRLLLNVLTEVISDRVDDNTTHPPFKRTFEGIAAQAGQYFIECVIQYFIRLPGIIDTTFYHTIE